MQAPAITVTEFTDAMCSWAWGTEPKLRLLQWRFDDQIDGWRHVMGHLVQDEHLPERDVVADAPKLRDYWKPVSAITGMPRPDPMHRATVGSRASGMLMKAAQRQGDDVARLVMRRLRESTFVHGEPPDSPAVALHAVRGVAGLDVDRLAGDVASDDVAAAYAADTDETRRPNEFVLGLKSDRPGIGKARQAADGRMRFVFPTLVVRGVDEATETTVPGWMPYHRYEEALFAAGAEPTPRTRSYPTPDEAFARWPSLAASEFEFLCGTGAELPLGVVTHEWEGGTLHLTEAEAAATR